MSPAEQRILIDIVCAGFVALILAMFALRFFRNAVPQPLPAEPAELPTLSDDASPPAVAAAPCLAGGLKGIDLAVACWGTLVLLFLTGLFFPAQTQGKAAELSEAAAPHSTQLLVLNFLVFQGGIVFCIVFYLRVLRGIALGPLFGLWNIRPARPPWLMFCLALFLIIPVLFLVYGTAPLWMQWLESAGLSLREQEGVEKIDGSAPLDYRLAMLATVCIGAPVAEELFFRGFLFETTKAQTSTPFAMIFTSIMFGAIHANVAAFFPLFLLGMIFAFLRWWVGSIYLPIFLHSLFNLATVIMKLYVPAAV